MTQKIKVKTTLVEMDGDEMTRIMWRMVKDKLLFPYLDMDIDYYDLHVVPYGVAQTNDRLWRANLLGGGRTLSLVNRLAQMRTLRQYAEQQDWDVGEGFIVGNSDQRKRAPHLTGHPYLPSKALTTNGIDKSQRSKKIRQKTADGDAK